MLNKFLTLSISIVLGMVFTSCLGGDDVDDYSKWRQENIDYILNAETETLDGKLRFEKMIPEWDNSVYTLMEWHNDKSQNESRLRPLSNSTIDVKYVLKNISGDTLDSSSSFRCLPNKMITGFWIAVTNMHEGDSVTAVIPYNAGYGSYSHGSVLPYSTLIFDIKLDSIVAYEKPAWK